MESDNSAPATPGSRLVHVIRETVSIIVGAAMIAFAFNTLALAQYDIPSESMVPTLRVGDRVVVMKWSYGYSRYSLPLGLGTLVPGGWRIFSSVPERGDIVVFVNPHTGEDYIKRVIGLPGDKVELKNGQIFINDEPVARTELGEMLFNQYRGDVVSMRLYDEFLPGADEGHVMADTRDKGGIDNYGPALVPDGHIFFMGDNRDNSSDSRATLGFVPMEYLVGRAFAISISFADCQEVGVAECAGRSMTGLR
ncbi:MAG TPA: signal peptidase I [Micropepsaceae bacterium]|nr:signal peptidase I [Micropepsaceae bacterium]